MSDKPQPEEWNGKARTAMAVNGVINYLHEIGLLTRWPEPDEMGDACSVAYHNLREAPHEKVMEYVKFCIDDEDSRMTRH